MQRFKPDLIVSIHAPYGVLDFDEPLAPPSRLGRLYLDQVGISLGSLGNYGGVHQGMPWSRWNCSMRSRRRLMRRSGACGGICSAGWRPRSRPA